MSKNHSSEPNCNNNSDSLTSSTSEQNGHGPTAHSTTSEDTSRITASKESDITPKQLHPNPSPRPTSPSPTGLRSSSGPSSRTRIFTQSKRSVSLTPSHQLVASVGKTDLRKGSVPSSGGSLKSKPPVWRPSSLRKAVSTDCQRLDGDQEDRKLDKNLNTNTAKDKQFLRNPYQVNTRGPNSVSSSSHQSLNSRGSSPRARYVFGDG